MNNQTPAMTTQPDKKNGHKPELAVLPEQASELAGVAGLSSGLLGATGDGTIEAQSTRLRDPRLQTVQRQAMAAQIGHTQGNHHLQGLIRSLKHQHESSHRQSEADSFIQMAPSVEVNEAEQVRQLMAQGEADENKLTNELYYRRHEDARGIKLERGSPGAREWLQIRDTIVRPALRSNGSLSTTATPNLAELAGGANEPTTDTFFQDVLKPLKEKLLDIVSTQESAPAEPVATETEAQTPPGPQVQTQEQVAPDQGSGKKLNDTLKAALELEKELRQKHADYGEKGGFQGYGTGQDQYVCTTFAREVLKRAGYDVSGGIWKQINVSINWQKELGKKNPNKEEESAALKRLVLAGDPRTKGIVTGLVESKQGIEVSIDQLQEGDFIQYWYANKAGGVSGHVVQVRKVNSAGDTVRVDVHGSHGMTRGVDTIPLTLRKEGKQPNWLKKVYCVRPTGSQANEAVSSAAAGAQGPVQRQSMAVQLRETHGQQPSKGQQLQKKNQRLGHFQRSQRSVLQRNPPSGTESSGSASGSSATTSGSRAPVIFGMDTTTRRFYASVTAPGHSIVSISTYIYGSPDKASELQRRNGVTDIAPPGRNLELVDGEFSTTANQAMNTALQNGTILRTEGVPTGNAGAGQILIYRFNAAGQDFELTEGQMRGMLQGMSVWLSRKADYIHGLAQGGQEVHQDHLDNTNSVVRGISDWLADQRELPTSIWNNALNISQEILDTLRGANVSRGNIADGSQIVSAQARRLEEAAAALDEARSQWHQYIEGTISGAGVAVHRLEITRNVSFGIAAGLAGAAVAPVVFTAAGTGLAAVGVTGTAATVVSGTAAIGAGAVTGGTLQGTLNVVAPGAEGERSAGDRFASGFERGALSGGLGAAGALAAPAVSGAISQSLYGQAPGALTTFGARATVGTLTGATLGAPLGATGASIANIGPLSRGEITPAQYLEHIGWAALEGATFGAALGFLSTALSGGPSRAITQPRPGAGGTTEPIWTTTQPQVNPQTGVVSQMARHGPTGQVFMAEYNPATGMGQMVNLSTGQQVATFSNGQFNPPAAGLLPSSTAATGAAPSPAGGALGTGTALAPVGAPATGATPSSPGDALGTGSALAPVGSGAGVVGPIPGGPVPAGAPQAPAVGPTHWEELATDPATGRLRPNEGDTALRVEQARGIQLGRYRPAAPTAKGDWVDRASGEVYDGCSPPRSQYFDRQLQNGNYEQSLRDHLGHPNVNYVVIDTTGLGLTPAQMQALEALITRVAGLNNPRIVRLP